MKVLVNGDKIFVYNGVNNYGGTILDVTDEEFSKNIDTLSPINPTKTVKKDIQTHKDSVKTHNLDIPDKAPTQKIKIKTKKTSTKK